MYQFLLVFLCLNADNPPTVADKNVQADRTGLPEFVWKAIHAGHELKLFTYNLNNNKISKIYLKKLSDT